MDIELVRTALSRRLREMEIPASTVSDYVHGRAKPSIMRAAAIEETLGIPAAAWAAGVPLEAMWKQLQTRCE